ncbi:MAG: carboxypeptidase regulatory-like domain-containing protein [Planctomycetes bacterium]|nr:carboxypeptidase regulatory-like domain-containing protein [Planctomycetota bacterium]
MNALVKAGLISLVVFAAIIAVFFLVPRGPRGPAPDDDRVAEVDARPQAPAEPKAGPEVRGTAIQAPVPRDAVKLTIEVQEKGRKRRLQGSRAMVLKAGDGDRPGDRVWESGKDGSGRWDVDLSPAAYQVRVQCPRYKGEMRLVTLIKDSPQTIVFELERGSSISGRVLAQGGGPIGGARVLALEELVAPGADLEETLINLIRIQEITGVFAAESVSAEDGTYSLDGLEYKTYTVRAIAAGYSPNEVVEIPAPRAEVDIVLPKGGSIGGSVADASNGSAVSDATVKAYAEVESQDVFRVIIAKARPPVDSARSDASGRFEFQTLGPGLYNFSIEAPGYQRGEQLKVRVAPGDRNALAFRLKPGLTLRGVVTGPSGEPVHGAKVRASVTGAGAAPRKDMVNIKFEDDSVITDEQGEYLIDTLEEGTYMVLCYHADYQTARRNDVHVRQGMDPLDLKLSHGGRLKGTVTDAASGKPLAGAKLSAADVADFHKDAVTGEDGSYLLAGLTASRAVSVNVTASGYARLRKEVKVEDNREVEESFALEPTGVVAGRVVTSGGDPIPNARVMAKKAQESGVEQTLASDVTDKDGRYSLTGIEAGENNVIRVKKSEFLEGASDVFSLKASESVDLPPIVLQLGGSLAGRVVGADGNGIGGAMVTVAFEGQTEIQQHGNPQCATNARGEFLIQGLRSGLVELVVKATHYLEKRVASVEVREGEIHRDIAIQLEQGGAVQGTVLDSKGQPVANAEVVGRDYAQGAKELRTQSGTDVRFTLEGIVSNDVIELEVSHDSFVGYSNPKVRVGTSDLQVVLKELGILVGRVVTADGKPVEAFTVQAQSLSTKDPRKQPKPQTFSPADGAFEYRGVPGGVYSVQVRAPQYSATTLADTNVPEGERVDLGDIVLNVGGIVTGTVVDSVSKAPVEGARVQIMQGSSRFLKADPTAGAGAANPVQTTGKDGTFSFSSMKGGAVTLRVTHPDYVARKVDDVNPDVAEKSQDLVIEMDQGGEITGIVLDADGKPRAGISVYLISSDTSANQTTQTDKDGTYRFQGVSSGTFTVKAHKFGTAGGGPEQAESTVEMSPGATLDVQLQLE